MVSFRGQKKLGPRPDWSPLRVSLKISDKHPHHFHMRGPLPPGILRAASAFYTVSDILAKYSMRFVVSVTCWTMSENY